MKIICEVNSLKEAKKISTFNNVDIILINLDFLSLDSTLMIEDKEAMKLIEFVQKTGKGVALNIDRLFHQDDMVYVKELVESCPCDYIFYSDLGVYQILSKLGLTDMAVYRAPTYMTNSNDINVFQMMNEYVVVSNQISSDELFEIVKNTKNNLIVDAVGMACCFYSKRPLVTNYLKFKDYKLKNYRSEVMKLKEETRDNFYHIVEDVNGTKVYEEAHYALTTELDVIKDVEYILLNRFNIKDKEYLKIVSLYNDYISGIISSSELDLKLNELDIEIYKGAYGKKTVLLKEDANE